MRHYHIAGALLAGALTFGGCATKGSVHALDAQMQDVRSEWRSFEQGYDPAMRAELERNLRTLESLNEEVRLLRDEVGVKARRVDELLAQIDNNELDRAIQECRRFAADADYFAATAQRHSDAALSYLEESRIVTRHAMQQHVAQHHRVDERALLMRLEAMEKRLAQLQHALEHDARADERERKNGKEEKGRGDEKRSRD